MQPRVLLIGDSITQYSFEAGGWGSALADWYVRHADVVNRGLDGWNSRWVLKHKDRVAASLGPAPAGTYLLGTLMLGANDNSTSYQHVPIDEYKANIRALALWMRDEIGVAHVLVMGPPPYCRHRHTAARQLPLDKAPRCDERHARYGDAAKEVATELGMGYLSLRDAIRGALGDEWPAALSDGLHLSEVGNKIVAAEVKKAIEQQFPHLVPSKLPHRLLPEFEAFEPYPDGNIPGLGVSPSSESASP